MKLSFPPIFLLPTHIPPDELDVLNRTILNRTYDIREAKIIVGKVTTKQRARLELRSQGIHTEDLLSTSSLPVRSDFGNSSIEASTLKRKRKHDRPTRRESDFTSSETSTEGEAEQRTSKVHKSLPIAIDDTVPGGSLAAQKSPCPPGVIQNVESTSRFFSKFNWDDSIKVVVKLNWLKESIAEEELLDVEPYLVYCGKQVTKKTASSPPTGGCQIKASDAF
jgi:DNA polymerase IV